MGAKRRERKTPAQQEQYDFRMYHLQGMTIKEGKEKKLEELKAQLMALYAEEDRLEDISIDIDTQMDKLAGKAMKIEERITKLFRS